MCVSKSVPSEKSAERREAVGELSDAALCVPGRGARERESSAGMASSPCGNTNFDSGLEIKTRSVEQTLVPLVSQVSAWRHFKKPHWLHNISHVSTHEPNFGSRVYLLAHGRFLPLPCFYWRMYHNVVVLLFTPRLGLRTATVI